MPIIKNLLFDKDKTGFLIAIIVSIFLFLRLSIIFTGFEKISHAEELISGSISIDLIQPKFNIIEYQGDNYSPSTLLSAFLILPAFLVFGYSVFSVKIAMLGVFTCLLILLFKFCDRFFDRKTALIAAFLFIFSPPMYTVYSLLNVGYHHWAGLFTLLQYFILFRICFEEGKSTDYPLLGIVSGFGLYANYSVFYGLITIIVFCAAFFRKAFSIKNLSLLLFGFLIGFLPWIYYNILNNFSGLYFILHGNKVLKGSYVLPNAAIDLALKLIDLITKSLPGSLCFRDMFMLKGRVLGYIYYYSLFLIPLIYFLSGAFKKIRAKKAGILGKKETAIILYIVIFALFFSVSNFKIGNTFIDSRYITPLYPFLFICTGLAFSKMSDRKSGKILLKCALVFIVIFFILGNCAFFTTDAPFLALKLKGYSYRIRGFYLGTKIQAGEDVRKIKNQIPLLNRRYARQIYYGLYEWGSLIAAPGDTPDEFIKKETAFIDNFNEEFKPFFYEKLGEDVFRRFIARTGRKIEEKLGMFAMLSEKIPKDYRIYAYTGAGYFMFRDKTVTGSISVDMLNKINSNYKGYFLKGAGRALSAIGTDEAGINKMIEAHPKYGRDICEGLGEGLVMAALDINNQPERRFKINAARGFMRRFKEKYPALFAYLNKGVLNYVDLIEDPYLMRLFFREEHDGKRKQ